MIRQAGIECPEVSIGSTPTAMFGKTFDGITEVRAGVYLFGDLYQTCLNTCSTDEIAISVLATVISVNHTRKTIVVDAGGLALSKDRGWRRGQNFGFGLVADERGKLFEARTIVQSVHQEHGEIEIKDESLLKTLSVGCRVRIYPNHACMTAAMYDQYIVVQGTNQSIVAIWGKARGW